MPQVQMAPNALMMAREYAEQGEEEEEEMPTDDVDVLGAPGARGVLPVTITAPKTNISYHFEKLLVMNESHWISVSFKKRGKSPCGCC